MGAIYILIYSQKLLIEIKVAPKVFIYDGQDPIKAITACVSCFIAGGIYIHLQLECYILTKWNLQMWFRQK